MLYILGINAYHGDAAAALIKDGILIAAAEEERFNRIKHCAGFPKLAIQYCLQQAGITPSDIDHIGISRDPSAHLHKKLLFSITRLHNMRGAIAHRLANVAKIRDLKEDFASALQVPKEQIKAKFHNVEHHKAHMASCFLVSSFERAAILSIDGFGDFISTMSGYGEGSKIKVLDQVEYPHSTGIVYTATTQYLGFPYYGDEGKIMGLAPYGQPRFLAQFRDIIRTDDNGSFSLNLDYFLHHSEGVEMSWDEGSPKIGRIFSDKFIEIFGPVREVGEKISSHHEDIAASLQARLEEVGFHILNHLYRKTEMKNLCLAGGVAYNSVMNGKILLNTPFEHLFIQPAAGDSGTALGVCFYLYNIVLGKPRTFIMKNAYTGPEFLNGPVEVALSRNGLKYETLDDEALAARAAAEIAGGKVVGWFQGRMEFGPRALGNRSIVADPRRADMKDILNERIKKREPFRPFAPSVLEEDVGEFFEQTHPSPDMLMVYQVKADKRALVPAITHVDGSGRLQTVSEVTNPTYYRLILAFKKLTGIPLVLNTSFNESEPIVCTPEEAIQCFLKTRMDVLFLGNCVVQR